MQLLKKLLPLFLMVAHSVTHAVVNGAPAYAKDAIARSTVLLVCIEEGHPADRIVSSGTGVIVGSHLILTAGHLFSICKPGLDATNNVRYRWEVRFGVDGLSPRYSVPIGPEDFLNEDPSRLMSPLNIDHDTYKDYAFVRLAGTLPAGMRPIQVQANTSAVTKRTPIYFAGYGYTHSQGTDYRLRTAKLAVTGLDATSPGMPPLDPHLNAWDQEYYIEFYSRTVHPCFGDSGGPFYRLDGGQPVLVAMLTHILHPHRRRGFCDTPSIGMRVEAVFDEMQRIIERTK